jgi:tetratricopeptide (TPR) repeat protein
MSLPMEINERNNLSATALRSGRIADPQSARISAIIDAALNACRCGTLAELMGERPLLARWFKRRYLSGAFGAGGDALADSSMLPWLAERLLRWALAEIRPDRLAGTATIDRDAWIASTSWRPMLAVMCHTGLAAVPDFRDRYRRSVDESPADNLCGLWAVGASTFYRYLDKGKRLMTQVVAELPVDSQRRLSLRLWVRDAVHARLGLTDPDQRSQWHGRQGADALLRLRFSDALWHQIQAGATDRALQTLQRHPTELAGNPETDALIEQLVREPLSARQRFDLVSAQASVWRARNSEDRELSSHEQALRQASDSGDRLMLGIAYGHLGKFHEARDADRAFACYEESAEYLRDAAPLAGGAADPVAVGHYLTTLVRLAWLHVLRNDPRSKALLDRADQLRSLTELPDEVVGLLEQTWGEYWRRAGQLQLALQRKHRALNIFERSGDQRSVLATYSNLCLIYGEAGEFDRAVACGQRVVAMAEKAPVEPEILLSAHMNMGIAHFGLKDYDRAIAAYQRALDQALAAALPRQQHLANVNLAEAYYKRLVEKRDPDDERRGDAHAAAALKASPSEASANLLDAARKLKSDILGQQTSMNVDRLLPQESALHFEEMADIQRQRAILAVPVAADAHARAHLAIANAYLSICVKERDAALALIARHDLGDSFAADLDRLRTTFDRQQSQEQRIEAVWRDAAAIISDEARRKGLIQALLRDGSINKSRYAEVGAVALATASKHLVSLAERGLLVQTGKGPSTRYKLAG